MTEPGHRSPRPEHEDVEPAHSSEQLAAKRQKRQLRGHHSSWAMRVATVQIILADAVMGLYGFSRGWGDIDPVVLDFWLGATVVEVLGIVYAITEGLFRD